MKELSIEEKAKAYHEALSVAQETYTTQPMYRDWLAKMFPELKESENWIPKEIAKYLKEKGDFRSCWLAWLEKQGDNPTPINIDKMVMKYSQTKGGDFGMPVNCMIRAYRQGIIDVLNLSSGIEKQGEKNHANSTKTCKGEHKPADNVEPKFHIGDIVKCKDNPHLTYILKRFTDDGDYEFQAIGKDGNEGCTCFSVVKYQDEWELVEQKPAEEYNITGIGSKNAQGKLGEMIKNLKPVNEVLEQKPAWSEENEDTIKFLISHFCVSHYNRSFQFTSNKLITHDELLEKIRNLRPQSTWKPSDEQMDIIAQSVAMLKVSGYDELGDRLGDISEQLNKLREE